MNAIERIYAQMIFHMAGENWINQPNTDPTLEDIIARFELIEQRYMITLEDVRGIDWESFNQTFRDLAAVRLELARLRSLIK